MTDTPIHGEALPVHKCPKCGDHHVCWGFDRDTNRTRKFCQTCGHCYEEEPLETAKD